MSLTVVTTFSQDNWDLYASRSIPTWLSRFPKDTKFHFHTNFQPLADPRIRYISHSKNKQDFLDRNHGREYTRKGKVKSYMTQWYKFCHKVYAQIDSSRICDTRYMLFLDADVAVIDAVPMGLPQQLLSGNFCGYIGRVSPSTETGFILYDVTQSGRWFDDLSAYYDQDRVFDLDHWDDCTVFDHCRAHSDRTFINLSGRYEQYLDPIALGPLGQWFDHWLSKSSKLKGQSKFRKHRGKL